MSKRWVLTAELALCGTALVVATWVASLPPMTYAQALHHSDTYLLWHSLIMHVAAVAAFAASLVLMIRLLLGLLGTWPKVSGWWHRLIVVCDNRGKS